ncbi:hypothetical protein [Streptomyces sp. G-5]|uniref:hypothetical protein n=1 Tax=Streptomyces sp. G-5 TaxID=2977231 RepID=UPI0021D1322E|nr:hypothetical protein [Streptomyces sp. G-5]MCU4750273.1 hypothetical protein [Streptomyces sp. G-5]
MQMPPPSGLSAKDLAEWMACEDENLQDHAEVATKEADVENGLSGEFDDLF